MHYLTLTPPHHLLQANTVHLARKAQYIATTWLRAIALASHLARLTTLARLLTHQWMAAAALREHTWMKTRNVFRTRSALAITKTPSLRPEKLLAKMATHGKHTRWDFTVGVALCLLHVPWFHDATFKLFWHRAVILFKNKTLITQMERKCKEKDQWSQ